MSLIKIKQYMQKMKVANLHSLAAHFGLDPELVRQMLYHLQCKGCVTRVESPSSCGTKCVKCPSAIREIYRWVDDKKPPQKTLNVNVTTA